jgi:hypothetical protein
MKCAASAPMHPSLRRGEALPRPDRGCAVADGGRRMRRPNGRWPR